ncbi:MAG: restriction endonuclease, partial [Ahniella sp.]|nr:restriction endonuclease [Ahniella sp.]
LPPQKAGFAFEKILNRLFALHGLAPREPFRVTGEQIDGSFELDHETYLVEAKWEKDPVSEASLLVFRGKIEGKSAYTRGAFISLSGVSTDAKTAISYGKQPTFFVIDGYDLAMVLSGDIDLDGFLRQRRRILAEEGALVVPYTDLWKGSRGRG